MMKLVFIAISVFAGTAVFAPTAQLTAGSTPTRASYHLNTASAYATHPALQLSPITRNQAIAGARLYAGGVFTKEVSVSARYASVDVSSQSARAADGSLHSLGTPDAWLVAVRGFKVRAFAGQDPLAKPGPITWYTNVTFVVSARTGKVLQATWGP